MNCCRVALVGDPSNGSEERMFLKQSAALKIAKMQIMISVLKLNCAQIYAYHHVCPALLATTGAQTPQES